MQRSQSLTEAIEAAEQVLSADIDSPNLKNLTRFASQVSGVSMDRLLLRIDLTGQDLRDQDISFLLPFEAQFEDAILSKAQRLDFKRASRSKGKQQTRYRIRSVRIKILSEFIEAYEADRAPLEEPTRGQLLSGDLLHDILIKPILEKYPRASPLDPAYMANILDALFWWVKNENLKFFVSLFSVLGDILCPADERAISVLIERYMRVYGDEIGALIAAFHPTKILDSWWINNEPDLNTKFKNLEQICLSRKVNISAVEQTLDSLNDIDSMLKALSIARFDCDNDQAERLALRITKSRWSAQDTHRVLGTKVHPKVRNALFRQLLSQGDESRVIEVLKWLNDNRGAVGALSLEDGFSRVRSFSAGIQFAESVALQLANNQMQVIVTALSKLVLNTRDKYRLNQLCRSFNASSRSSGKSIRVS